MRNTSFAALPGRPMMARFSVIEFLYQQDFIRMTRLCYWRWLPVYSIMRTHYTGMKWYSGGIVNYSHQVNRFEYYLEPDKTMFASKAMSDLSSQNWCYKMKHAKLGVDMFKTSKRENFLQDEDYKKRISTSIRRPV